MSANDNKYVCSSIWILYGKLNLEIKYNNKEDRAQLTPQAQHLLPVIQRSMSINSTFVGSHAAELALWFRLF